MPGRLSQRLLGTRPSLYESLIQQGLSTAPIGHWTQGLARLAQAYVGSRGLQDLEKKSAEQDAALQKTIMEAFGPVKEKLPDYQGPVQPVPEDLKSFGEADQERFLGQSGTQFGLPEAPMVERDPRMMEIAQRLGGNPETQDLATQLMMKAAASREAAQMAEAARAGEMEDWKTQYGIKSADAAKIREQELADKYNIEVWKDALRPKKPGVDEPYSPEVYDQLLGIAKEKSKIISPYQTYKMQEGLQEQAAKKLPERKPPENAAAPFVQATPWDTMPEAEKPGMMSRVYTQDVARLRKEQDAIKSNPQMKSNLQRFKYLNSLEETGGPLDRLTDFSFDEQKREMVAITNRLTPAMRQGMPGAASDRDVAMFRGATVGIGNTKAINDALVTGMSTMIENSDDRLDFMREYLRVNKHLEGAEAYWKQYLEDNPIFDPSEDEGSYVINKNRMNWKDYFRGGERKANTTPRRRKGDPPPGFEVQQ